MPAILTRRYWHLLLLLLANSCHAFYIHLYIYTYIYIFLFSCKLLQMHRRGGDTRIHQIPTTTSKSWMWSLRYPKALYILTIQSIFLFSLQMRRRGGDTRNEPKQDPPTRSSTPSPRQHTEGGGRGGGGSRLQSKLCHVWMVDWVWMDHSSHAASRV